MNSKRATNYKKTKPNKRAIVLKKTIDAKRAKNEGENND